MLSLSKKCCVYNNWYKLDDWTEWLTKVDGLRIIIDMIVVSDCTAYLANEVK